MNIREYHELIYRQKIFFKDITLEVKKKKVFPMNKLNPFIWNLLLKLLILPIVIVGARMG